MTANGGPAPVSFTAERTGVDEEAPWPLWTAPCNDHESDENAEKQYKMKEDKQ
jgi:hypothetical protein